MKRQYSERTTQNPLYSCWHHMKQRCRGHQQRRYYFDRGITHCPDWESFDAFREWALATGYEAGLEIDRIDVDGNYEPSNCRWVNHEIQMGNTRRVIKVAWEGQTHCLAKWARLLGIEQGCLLDRYNRGLRPPELFFKERFRVPPESVQRGDQHWTRRDPEKGSVARRGEKNPNAKLTDNQVQEIRQRHAAGAVQRTLAVEFQVSPATVCRIVKKNS